MRKLTSKITSLFGSGSDRAENSIMQTVTIAVSVIIIAGGMLSAPGMINQQRDNVVQVELSAAAFAQEKYIAANGFVNQDYLPGSTGDDPLAEGKFGYTFSESSWDSSEAEWCVEDTEYIISGTSKSGNVFFVSSETLNATTEDKVITPVSCRDDYIAPVDTTPINAARLSPPSSAPTGLAVVDPDNVKWDAVTCADGTMAAYQLRVTKVAGANISTNSGGWSSTTSTSLGFLDNEHKAGGQTDFAVAAKCRSIENGKLSKTETVSGVLTHSF